MALRACERREFVPLDVVALVLRETVNKECPVAFAKQHDRSEPAGFALTLPGKPLLAHGNASLMGSFIAPGRYSP